MKCVCVLHWKTGSKVASLIYQKN